MRVTPAWSPRRIGGRFELPDNHAFFTFCSVLRPFSQLRSLCLLLGGSSASARTSRGWRTGRAVSQNVHMDEYTSQINRQPFLERCATDLVVICVQHPLSVAGQRANCKHTQRRQGERLRNSHAGCQPCYTTARTVRVPPRLRRALRSHPGTRTPVRMHACMHALAARSYQIGPSTTLPRTAAWVSYLPSRSTDQASSPGYPTARHVTS